MKVKTKILIALLIPLFVYSCSSTEHQQTTPLQNSALTKIVIGVDPQAPTPVKKAANDLKVDLHSTLSAQTEIVIADSRRALPRADYYFLVGRLSALHPLDEKQTQEITRQNPGTRGGVITQYLYEGKPLVVLSGEDVQGTQYTVYDYAKLVLGVDPLAYWTGKEPEKLSVDKLKSIENRVIQPPVVPLLVYFENDVDELANLHPPMLQYDWQSFTAMIDSLVRLRYNGIELFDMLGRVEFYTRPEYVAAFPDYKLDMDYLKRMMDYIHSKGMYIQINMMMGRQVRTLREEAASCWKNHKQEWIDIWEYYLTDTPFKDADIFALTPRDQVLDRDYKSTCNEDNAQVFNEAFRALGTLLDKYKPKAPRICTCYHHGMEIFNADFNPPEDYIIAWSNNGWAEFDYLPKDTKGYRFGTYMHAGFWLNHDVHDPYPELIDKTLTTMFNDYDATSYLMVNGQTFRPFMLNLEAYSEAARLGTKFDGKQFHHDWVARYVNEDQVDDAVKTTQLLHEAHYDKTGYVEILWQIKKMTAYLSNQLLQRPNRPSTSVDYQGVKKYDGGTEKRIELLNRAAAINSKMLADDPSNDFLHDYFALPVELYRDLLILNQQLIDMSKLKNRYEVSGDKKIKLEASALLIKAKNQLDVIYERRLVGDKNKKWATWYDPKKRRPNNGFPSKDSIEQIEKAIPDSW